MTQITTCSFFSYQGFFKKIWGLSQMQLVHAKLRNVPGLEFYKMMGSGDGNGFSLQPDFGTYALLMIWKERSFAKSFFSKHTAMTDFGSKTEVIKTFYIKATKAHGLWGGQQPFEINGAVAEDKPMVVLTRARIKPQLAYKFWKEVPSVSKSIEGAPGLIFSKGIGEWPIFYQATLSIWKCKADMVNFAYHSPKHAEVIKKTRELAWYSEELFAEFELLNPGILDQ